MTTTSTMNRSLVSKTCLSLALPLIALACSSNSTPTPQPNITTPGVTATSGAPAMPAQATTSNPVAAAGAPGMTTQTPLAGTAASDVPAGASGTGAAPASPTGPKSAGTPAVEPETPMTQATPTADWTMMGYDSGSTYFNKGETKITKENVANLTIAFQADMAGDVYGAPLQVGDKIYALSLRRTMAFDASGKVLWMLPNGSFGSLTYADGLLYVNKIGARINAINAADGTPVWSKSYSPVSTDGISSPTIAGDLLLVGGSNGGIEIAAGEFRGFVSAIDRKTGDMKWSTFTVPDNANGASIWSTPSADIAGGMVYASTGNNYGPPATDSSDSIIAFDMATGTIKYKYQATQDDTYTIMSGKPDADFGANPVLYETMVNGVMTKVAAAGDKGGTAHAIRRDTGALLWKRALGMGGNVYGTLGIFTNSAWTGKYMLFAANEGGPATLYALDGATGDIVWQRKLDGMVWGRTAVANGVGFVGAGTNLEAFDVDTGKLIKSWPSKSGTIASTITVSNGRVAFGEGLNVPGWSSGRPGSTLTVLKLP